LISHLLFKSNPTFDQIRQNILSHLDVKDSIRLLHVVRTTDQLKYQIYFSPLSRLSLEKLPNLVEQLKKSKQENLVRPLRCMRIEELISEPKIAAKYLEFNQFTNLEDVAHNIIQYASVQDLHGRTAFHYAAERGDYLSLKLLIYFQPCGLNQPDDYGDTPLFRAAFFNKTRCVRVLLRADFFRSAVKVDSNQANYRGETPLHAAALRGNRVVCNLLVVHGANISCRNQRGLFPVDYARLMRKKHSVQTQRSEKKIQRYNKICTLLSVPGRYRTVQGIYKKIIDHGEFPNKREKVVTGKEATIQSIVNATILTIQSRVQQRSTLSPRRRAPHHLPFHLTSLSLGRDKDVQV